ncbi:hypothetical protein COLO4_02426 [Corchorus olitorius]|uniref:Uncharacterized protein n=1 Tax=Corchorus olitorius TaxID=93759 RepID=A0A1R3L132_9ROSI|nr:hypothetical protein COLO4_02426 [Corchorus olitorius]
MLMPHSTPDANRAVLSGFPEKLRPTLQLIEKKPVWRGRRRPRPVRRFLRSPGHGVQPGDDGKPASAGETGRARILRALPVGRPDHRAARRPAALHPAVHRGHPGRPTAALTRLRPVNAP